MNGQNAPTEPIRAEAKITFPLMYYRPSNKYDGRDLTVLGLRTFFSVGCGSFLFKLLFIWLQDQVKLPTDSPISFILFPAILAIFSSLALIVPRVLSKPLKIRYPALAGGTVLITALAAYLQVIS